MLKQGKDSKYRALHQWVQYWLGKPSECSNCATTQPIRYEWSNISGEYRCDLSDWQRLCVPRHRKIDRAGLCEKKLHELTPDNTYISPSKTRRCKACRVVSQRAWVKRTNYNARRRAERNAKG